MLRLLQNTLELVWVLELLLPDAQLRLCLLCLPLLGSRLVQHLLDVGRIRGYLLGKDLNLPLVLPFAQRPLLLQVAELLERVELKLRETLGVRLEQLNDVR